jgi:hypothetical protein
MTRKRIIRDGSSPARRSTTITVSAADPAPPACATGTVVVDAVAPPPEPRLLTQSDEVQELRAALIAMLWDVVGGEEDESCDGHCEDGDQRLGAIPGTPFPACAAVRALGWSEHFDAKAFEQRASR